MAKKDFSTVPVTVTIKNEGSEEVGFRYFRVNFIEVLQPSDEVVLSAASSEEAAYYLSLNDEKIGLKVTKA